MGKYPYFYKLNYSRNHEKINPESKTIRKSVFKDMESQLKQNN